MPAIQRFLLFGICFVPSCVIFYIPSYYAAAEFCKRLKAEREESLKEIDQLRTEIESFQSDIRFETSVVGISIRF
jgi:hypothetical protein